MVIVDDDVADVGGGADGDRGTCALFSRETDGDPRTHEENLNYHA